MHFEEANPSELPYILVTFLDAYHLWVRCNDLNSLEGQLSQLLLFIAQRIFLSKREAVIQEKTLIPWIEDDQQVYPPKRVGCFYRSGFLGRNSHNKNSDVGWSNLIDPMFLSTMTILVKLKPRIRSTLTVINMTLGLILATMLNNTSMNLEMSQTHESR